MVGNNYHDRVFVLLELLTPSLAEELRHKHLLKIEPQSENENGTLPAENDVLTCPRPRRRQSEMADCDLHMTSITSIVEHLLHVLDDIQVSTTVTGWRKEVIALQESLPFPNCSVAICGDSGAGKSSLFNALLNHCSILPTSGVQACTAAVVELRESVTGYYEADVEFLSKEDWENELKHLTENLRTSTGLIRVKEPDPTRYPDVAVAWGKVRAVHGTWDRNTTIKKLMSCGGVVRHLGTTLHITEQEHSVFTNKVSRYVEQSGNRDAAGGQFWPVIKKVTLYVPNTDVLRNGMTLVDLPGTQDANAARDRMARQV